MIYKISENGICRDIKGNGSICPIKASGAFCTEFCPFFSVSSKYVKTEGGWFDIIRCQTTIIGRLPITPPSEMTEEEMNDYKGRSVKGK